jgi:DNA-directed RNA polymerase specialized sigma24 family protein
VRLSVGAAGFFRSGCILKPRSGRKKSAYYGLVLACAGRRVGPDLAQDVVAEAFLAAWRNIHELPPQPPPWLYRAAHFAVSNQRRTLAWRGRLDDRARLQAASVSALDRSELVAPAPMRSRKG